jgi:hypothetical protein
MQPKLQETFDSNYFDALDNSARDILKILSNNAHKLISTVFSEVFFTLVSSLGMTPINIIGHKVDSPALIKPWRVEMPLIHLLMKIGFLPPFDKTKVLPPPEEPESEDDRKERKKANAEKLNEWGSIYCKNWSKVIL